MALYLYHKYAIAPADMDSGAGVVNIDNIAEVLELAEKGYRSAWDARIGACCRSGTLPTPL